MLRLDDEGLVAARGEVAGGGGGLGTVGVGADADAVDGFAGHGAFRDGGAVHGVAEGLGPGARREGADLDRVAARLTRVEPEVSLSSRKSYCLGAVPGG